MNERLWSAKREALLAEIGETQEQIADYEAEGARNYIELEDAKRTLAAAREHHDALEGRRAQLAELRKGAQQKVAELTKMLQEHAGQRPMPSAGVETEAEAA